ncbi:hypothetical protein [Micromonospora psammae]|uniref:hypothetical protein n=1 Tax=Micromonospora sp. CPCC 205556 TaxID=3122398 RepID=UPI002FEEAFED
MIDASAAGRTPGRRNPITWLFMEAEARPRRGWRLAAYLVILLVATGVVGSTTRGSLVTNVAGHAVIAVVALVVTYGFRRYVDRRPWHSVGLSAWRWRHVATGLMAGAASRS